MSPAASGFVDNPRLPRRASADSRRANWPLIVFIASVEAGAGLGDGAIGAMRSGDGGGESASGVIKGACAGEALATTAGAIASSDMKGAPSSRSAKIGSRLSEGGLTVLACGAATGSILLPRAFGEIGRAHV